MKKHPFLLIEVFIAFSILSLSSFIFTDGQQKLFAKEKKKILDLEFERFAEMEYIELRSKAKETLSWNQLSTTKTTMHPTRIPFNPQIKQFKADSYPSHYHLHYSPNTSPNSSVRNLFVEYCYELKSNSCFFYKTNDPSAKTSTNNYKFQFFVVQKQEDPA